MNDQLDGEIRAVLARLDDMTPLPPAFDELARVVERRGVARRGWRRPAVSIAAATVAVVSLIGLVWALQGRSTTPPAVQQAPAPTVATTPSQLVGTDAVAAPLELEGFPALDPGDPRNGGAQAVYARSGGGTNQRSTAALVGRRLGDRLVDGIMIVAHRHRDAAVVGPQPVQSTIVGNIEVDYVVEPGTPAITTAIVRGEPTITYSGRDPIGFLMNAGLDAATASVDGTGHVELRIGELPEGYDVVLPPEPLSVGSRSASLQLTAGDTADGTLILVSVNRPVLGMAAVGDLEAVDINGTPGWISSTAGYAVTWPVGEHTWAVVIGNAALATSIEVARAVEFVDGRMACPV